MVKADAQDGIRSNTTRRKILDAAALLIAELGWSDVTTRRIAERAGVNNALIHYYFGTKEALLIEAASTMFAEEFEGPMTRMAAARTFGDGLRAFVDYLRVIEEHGPGVTVSVEALLRGVRDEAVRAWIEVVLGSARQLLEQLVTAAQGRGELPADLDIRGAAVVLAALLDGLVLYRLVSPDLDLDAVESSLLAMMAASPKGIQ
ncbi:MAG: TetR/AcrR family transcriptional regulator [Acidimicrobiia bacterium]|nr:TetR/AcrR family transcriptional regulator [Acidimicrobiia bacterium]